MRDQHLPNQSSQTVGTRFEGIYETAWPKDSVQMPWGRGKLHISEMVEEEKLAFDGQ